MKNQLRSMNQEISLTLNHALAVTIILPSLLEAQTKSKYLNLTTVHQKSSNLRKRKVDLVDRFRDIHLKVKQKNPMIKARNQFRKHWRK